MSARGLATAVGIGVAACSGCSLFVSLDGLSGTSDAGISANDAALDQSVVTTSDSGADAGVDAAPSYAETVLADHPLAYFHFDETTGDVAADSSGNGHDAHYVNGYALGGAGAFPGSGTSVHLLGSAFVQIDDSVNDAGTPFDFADHAPFTLEAWVNIDTQPVLNSTEFTFFSKEKQISSDNFLGIDFFSEPGLKLQREDDPTDETEAHTSIGLPSVSTWHYVVGTFDGTTLTMFVNLEPVASADSSTTSLPVTDVPFIIGAEQTNGENGVLGLVDEAAVYDHALTLAELTAHYHAAGR